jgi:Na+/H+ antiporter NhaD/arsenite permease-like protein
MISALAVLPLEVYIIRDISQLYGIDYVVNLPREVLFGVLMLIGLLKISLKDKDIFDKKKDEDEDEYGIMAGVKSLIKTILFVVVLLMSWMVAYIVHSVNHF